MSKTFLPFEARLRARAAASVVLPTPPVPQKISNDLAETLTLALSQKVPLFYMSFERDPTKSD